jgi:hypothetical protein
MTTNITEEIQSILNKDKLEDLKQFISRRKSLNFWNIGLVYLFHAVQAAGILTTTIAAGYDSKEIIWVGVGLNILASLINVIEKTNSSISKHLLKDIEAIKDGTYVDESEVVEIPEKKENNKDTPLLKE